MALQAQVQEFLAARSLFQLIFIASFIVSIAVFAVRSFTKYSVDDLFIPLYTPETVAEGNYKKRWSYDNPNALREAYQKVR